MMAIMENVVPSDVRLPVSFELTDAQALALFEHFLGLDSLGLLPVSGPLGQGADLVMTAIGLTDLPLGGHVPPETRRAQVAAAFHAHRPEFLGALDVGDGGPPPAGSTARVGLTNDQALALLGHITGVFLDLVSASTGTGFPPVVLDLVDAFREVGDGIGLSDLPLDGTPAEVRRADVEAGRLARRAARGPAPLKGPAN